MSVNKEDFYLIFPYDQYLLNHDRHADNFLIYKDANTKPKHFWMIDSDRIFEGNKPKNFIHFIDTYKCLDEFDKSKLYYKRLYEAVNDVGFTKILKESIKFEMITDEDIDELCNIIYEFYTLSKREIDIISMVLKKRREDFYNKCISNQECFPNIKEKRLSSV